MHLTYEKLGTDHKLYGKVDYVVMDAMQPICYKGKEGYVALEADATIKQPIAPQNNANQRVNSLFVLSFKVNGESEEMTFKSKKKMDKTIAFYKGKEFISDLETQEYKLA